MNHYTTLGVRRDATDVEIKRAFKLLAKQHHPDKTDNDPVHAAQMVEVNLAYGVLITPAERTGYNKYLNREHKVCVHCAGKGYAIKQQGFKKQLRVTCPTCGGAGCD